MTNRKEVPEGKRWLISLHSDDPFASSFDRLVSKPAFIEISYPFAGINMLVRHLSAKQIYMYMVSIFTLSSFLAYRPKYRLELLCVVFTSRSEGEEHILIYFL